MNEIERMAQAADFRTVMTEAQEDKALGPLIAPHLRTLLFDLDRVAGAGEKVKRGLAVLKSFLNGLQLSIGDVTVRLDIDPENGAADSGDVEIDLPNLFVAVAEAAEGRKSAVDRRVGGNAQRVYRCRARVALVWPAPGRARFPPHRHRRCTAHAEHNWLLAYRGAAVLPGTRLPPASCSVR